MSEGPTVDHHSDNVALAVEYVQELEKTENELEIKKQEYKELEAKAKALKEDFLPNLLEKLNLNMLPLADGRRVEMKRSLHATISKERQQAAYAWLMSNGGESLFKTEVSVKLPKGDIEKAKMIEELIEAKGERPSISTSVHHKTLTSWVEERLQSGVDIPQELLGVYERRVVSIK